MAVRFDASTDVYTATTGMPTGGTYSFTCWVCLDADQNNYTAVVEFQQGADVGLWLEAFADGTTIGLGSVSTDMAGGRATTVGQWSRFGVSLNGTSCTLVHGGDSGALTTSSGTLTGIPTAPTKLFVGSDEYNAWLNGRVAAFKVWNATLTTAELAVELTQYVPVRGANLLRWHPWVGAETTDRSGNGNDLTAGSTATATGDGPPIPWTVTPVPQPLVARRRATNF